MRGSANCHAECECLFSSDYLTMSGPDCAVIVTYKLQTFYKLQLIRASLTYLGPVGGQWESLM